MSKDFNVKIELDNLFRDKAYKELRDEIYPALQKAKDAIGEKMVDRIYRLLIDGYLHTQEADYLQDMRRDNMAEYLGMTFDEYERFLKGENIKGSRKIPSDSNLLKKILGMDK